RILSLIRQQSDAYAASLRRDPPRSIVVEVEVKGPTSEAREQRLDHVREAREGGPLDRLGPCELREIRRDHEAVSRQRPDHAPGRSRGKPWIRSLRPQPRRAASIAAMSIFLICSMASNARLATAGSGSLIASI